MSFTLFGIEFDGRKDCNSMGEQKMNEVCQIVGTKLIREWIKYGKQTGKLKSNEVNDLYKWIRLLEEDFDGFFNLEIEKIENEISQIEIQNDLWMNNNVWEDWFDSFKTHFDKICNYTKFEDKRKFLKEYIDNIYVEWDEKTNTHNIKINFKLNIVKDKGELVGKDIYKIVKGKNEIDINGINVRKFTNYINKERQNKTYLLNYSTVTDFAKFLGWSTFLFSNTAI